MTTENRKPVHTIRSQHLVVTVWERASHEGKVFHTISVERLYMPQGIQALNVFCPADVQALQEALSQAGAWLKAQQAEESNGVNPGA